MKECCEKNRFVVDVKKNQTGKQYIEKCSVCGAKHYRLKAKPIQFGVTGQPI